MMLDLKNFSRSLLEDKGHSVSQSDDFGHAYLWIGTRGDGGGGGGGVGVGVSAVGYGSVLYIT